MVHDVCYIRKQNLFLFPYFAKFIITSKIQWEKIYLSTKPYLWCENFHGNKKRFDIYLWNNIHSINTVEKDLNFQNQHYKPYPQVKVKQFNIFLMIKKKFPVLGVLEYDGFSKYFPNQNVCILFSTRIIRKIPWDCEFWNWRMYLLIKFFCLDSHSFHKREIFLQTLSKIYYDIFFWTIWPTTRV